MLLNLRLRSEIDIWSDTLSALDFKKKYLIKKVYLITIQQKQSNFLRAFNKFSVFGHHCVIITLQTDTNGKSFIEFRNITLLLRQSGKRTTYRCTYKKSVTSLVSYEMYMPTPSSPRGSAEVFRDIPVFRKYIYWTRYNNHFIFSKGKHLHYTKYWVA